MSRKKPGFKKFDHRKLNGLIIALLLLGGGTLILGLYVFRKNYWEELPTILTVAEAKPESTLRLQETVGLPFPLVLPGQTAPEEVGKILRSELTRTAREMVKTGQLDLAVWIYHRIWMEDPQTPDLVYDLALLAFQRDQKAKGEELLHASLDRGQRRVECHNLLGLIHLDRGELPQSRDQFKKAVECDPNEAQSYFNLGEVLRKLGETDLALEQLRTALKLKPDVLLYSVKLNLALIDSGQVGNLSVRSELELSAKPESLEWGLISAALALREGQTIRAASILETIQKSANPANFKYILKDPAFSRYSTLEEIAPFYSDKLAKSVKP
jgi:tetratricopeptide (TPR) repeat protein